MSILAATLGGLKPGFFVWLGIPQVWNADLYKRMGLGGSRVRAVISAVL